MLIRCKKCEGKTIVPVIDQIKTGATKIFFKCVKCGNTSKEAIDIDFLNAHIKASREWINENR